MPSLTGGEVVAEAVDVVPQECAVLAGYQHRDVVEADCDVRQVGIVGVLAEPSGYLDGLLLEFK